MLSSPIRKRKRTVAGLLWEEFQNMLPPSERNNFKDPKSIPLTYKSPKYTVSILNKQLDTWEITFVAPKGTLSFPNEIYTVQFRYEGEPEQMGDVHMDPSIGLKTRRMSKTWMRKVSYPRHGFPLLLILQKKGYPATIGIKAPTISSIACGDFSVTMKGLIDGYYETYFMKCGYINALDFFQGSAGELRDDAKDFRDGNLSDIMVRNRNKSPGELAKESGIGLLLFYPFSRKKKKKKKKNWGPRIAVILLFSAI